MTYPKDFENTNWPSDISSDQKVESFHTGQGSQPKIVKAGEYHTGWSPQARDQAGPGAGCILRVARKLSLQGLILTPGAQDDQEQVQD